MNAQVSAMAFALTSLGEPSQVMRSVRVPEALWEQAKAKADERHESISDIVREALERYVRADGDAQPR